MKKPLSAMSAQDFVEATGALGLNYKQMARTLNKRQPTVSGYATGRHPIPQDVAEQIGKLLDAHLKEVKELGYRVNAANPVGSLIVYHNERKDRNEPHRTEGRFMRRTNKPDTRVFPAYRMSLERYQTYIAALSSWNHHVRGLALKHGDEKRQRDYRLELADIKLLADTAPRNAPYDMYIEHSQWDVVSRALRHYASLDSDKYRAAHALRMHWWKYRGSGYPVPRKAAARG
jgi:hypothetical protein